MSALRSLYGRAASRPSPRKLRSNMLNVGEPAPEVTLPDQDGRAVALASLWRQQPTVLVFLRHFG
jgi:cytochrome oxidase Cu insertion factor (SCO1/SenC/PrrC family)